MYDGNIVGYWISDKKRQKFNWSEFEDACKNEGLILKKVLVFIITLLKKESKISNAYILLVILCFLLD